MSAIDVKIQPGEFEFLSELLKKKSGLALTPNKEYLLESRLLPIARSHKMQTLSELVTALKTNSTGPILTEVIEAMTTNESLFFRDSKPFEQLQKELLAPLCERAKPRGKMSIWSAASSTGQEPYSMAMTLLESKHLHNMPCAMLASDIAQKVIDKAIKGEYSQFEVQRGMPIALLMKYFTQVPDTTNWQVKDELKKMVQYRTYNLLDNFASLGMFDIILARNVLIYFDDATKEDIVRRMCKQLHPEGLLIVGSSESLMYKDLPVKNIAGMAGIFQMQS